MKFDIKFDCDKKKAKLNFLKHGLRFTEGCRIFYKDVLTSESPVKNETSELRYITLGELEKEIVLVVVWTIRLHNKRIISVRKASRKEREKYYGHIEKKN